MKNPKLIVLPDIHGRKFWEIIKDHPDVPAIFLGDYLDPYQFEEITPTMAIDNFQEIIETVKQRDNVTMLLGNHDLTYELGKIVCQCRTIYDRYDELRKMFWDNKGMFNIVKYMEIGGKKFSFTHAGITPGFWRMMTAVPVIIGSFEDTLKNEHDLNAAHRRHWDKFCDQLRKVSSYRGGLDPWSSLVWADVSEHIEVAENFSTDVIQIFGHTLCNQPIHFNNKCYEFYMLDSREPFYIDDKGDVRRCSTDETISLIKNK